MVLGYENEALDRRSVAVVWFLQQIRLNVVPEKIAIAHHRLLCALLFPNANDVDFEDQQVKGLQASPVTWKP